MRSEQEMMKLILDFAKEKKDIRAVYMNGSRANPKAPKDILQDYDIVYAVASTTPYREDTSWLSHFGEIAVMQEPDDRDFWDNDAQPERSYAYLLQFVDGNRIDLTFQALETAKENFGKDSLTVLLLDKDHAFPSLPSSDDSSYWVKKTTQKEFSRCCNEFWWVSCYAAKGIWRNEPTYALEMMNTAIRPQLYKMLCWYGGILTSFRETAGKCGKYLPKLLPEKDWDAYLATYPSAKKSALVEALRNMLNLFRKAAHLVAKEFHFAYNEKEEIGSMQHTENLLQNKLPHS